MLLWLMNLDFAGGGAGGGGGPGGMTMYRDTRRRILIPFILGVLSG